MSRRKGEAISGWLNVDKPQGPTSSAVVGRLRRAFGAAKAGHGGTLDPLATGVLPIAFGEATKVMGFVVDTDKRYRFTVRWGEARTTDDAAGEVLESSPRRPIEAEIRAALPRFTGPIEQIPPRFSALKIGGRRAYALARAGAAVDLAPRQVAVRALDFAGSLDPDHAVFEVACGKGTYVRSLARDLARALGTVGHVAALRRLAVGPFRAEAAIPLDLLIELGHSPAAFERLLPILTPLADIPAVAVTGAEAELIRSGQAVPVVGHGRPDLLNPLRDGDVVRVTTGELPVAMARLDNGQLRPVRVFNL
ncbi:MAG TPA: tRNA pseudouridine(55) synthase TruB [Candidatus Sulfotelmatobacter sp.]|nr:tRNA pseudouridine(55) synthase TruB [Candidatus Sulfotelmatobacter sp.]